MNTVKTLVRNFKRTPTGFFYRNQVAGLLEGVTRDTRPPAVKLPSLGPEPEFIPTSPSQQAKKYFEGGGGKLTELARKIAAYN